MNILLALLGICIFAAALYGIIKTNKKSTQSAGGYGGGVVIGGDASDKPGDVFPNNPGNKEYEK